MTTAVTQEQPLGEHVARLCWTYATVHHDKDVMIGLAGRNDLPDDIQRGLQQVDDVAVRVAYLNRPDLDPAIREQLLAKETRAKVLAVLASAPDTDPAILESLAHHETVTVAVAVIANKDATLDIRRAAAINVDARGKNLTYVQEGVMRALIEHDVEYHDTYAAHLHRKWLGYLIGAGAIGPESVRRIVDECITKEADYIRSTADGGHMRSNRAHGIVRIANDTLLLAEVPDDVLDAIKIGLQIAGKELKINSGSTNVTYNQAIGRLRTRSNGRLAKDLFRARHSTDQDELAALVYLNQDRAVLDTVAKNRATSPATTVAACKYATPTLPGNLLTARAGQNDVLLALWEYGYSPLTYSWKPTADDVPLALTMLASPVASPQVKRSLADRMFRQGILPDEAVGLLPQAAFDRSTAGTPIAALGVSVLETGLGDVPPELVLSVATDFVGSLDDLLDTCRLFAVEESA